MSLRGIVILVLVAAGSLASLVNPYYGVLTWNWLAYMNPHQMAWQSLDQFRLAYVAGIAVILGMFVTRQWRPVRAPELAALGLFSLALIVSTIAATNRPAAQDKLIQYGKIFVICYAMICVTKTERRFRVLIWTTAIFMCAIGIKGAILSQGREFPRIYGPDRSFIADNNDYALAMNMMVPFFWVMGVTEWRRWLKYSWFACGGLTMLAVLFTYSRGGYLGLALTVLYMTLRSKRKMLALAVLAVGVVVLFRFAPERLGARMDDLDPDNFNVKVGDDLSSNIDTAQTRINAWKVAIAMGSAHPLTGVGLRNFYGAYEEAARDVEDADRTKRVAHSAYFHIFAEAGFPGLLTFLGVIGVSWFGLIGLQRLIRRLPDNVFAGEPVREWNDPTRPPPPPVDVRDRLVRYGVMCEASLVSYAATAAFLSRADFDLFFQIVAMVVMLRELVRMRVAAAAAAPAEKAALKPDAAQIPVGVHAQS